MFFFISSLRDFYRLRKRIVDLRFFELNFKGNNKGNFKRKSNVF